MFEKLILDTKQTQKLVYEDINWNLLTYKQFRFLRLNETRWK